MRNKLKCSFSAKDFREVNCTETINCLRLKSHIVNKFLLEPSNYVYIKINLLHTF